MGRALDRKRPASRVEEVNVADIRSAIPVVSKHTPWNKGKIVGAKPPLRPEHVWSIRTKLQVGGRIRELALSIS
jgi:hypothetical protein